VIWSKKCNFRSTTGFVRSDRYALTTITIYNVRDLIVQ